MTVKIKRDEWENYPTSDLHWLKLNAVKDNNENWRCLGCSSLIKFQKVYQMIFFWKNTEDGVKGEEAGNVTHIFCPNCQPKQLPPKGSKINTTEITEIKDL